MLGIDRDSTSGQLTDTYTRPSAQTSETRCCLRSTGVPNTSPKRVAEVADRAAADVADRHLLTFCEGKSPTRIVGSWDLSVRDDRHCRVF